MGKGLFSFMKCDACQIYIERANEHGSMVHWFGGFRIFRDNKMGEGRKESPLHHSIMVITTTRVRTKKNGSKFPIYVHLPRKKNNGNLKKHNIWNLENQTQMIWRPSKGTFPGLLTFKILLYVFYFHIYTG